MVDENGVKDNLEVRINSAFEGNRGDLNECVKALKVVFISDYYGRFRTFYQEHMAGEDSSFSLAEGVDSVGDMLRELVVANTYCPDDPLITELISNRMPVIKRCFDDLLVRRKHLELFKNILLWTLTWMRDDMDGIETWLWEVPGHLERFLIDRNFMPAHLTKGESDE